MESIVFVTKIISQKLNVEDGSLYSHEETLSSYQASKDQLLEFKNPTISKVILQ